MNKGYFFPKARTQNKSQKVAIEFLKGAWSKRNERIFDNDCKFPMVTGFYAFSTKLVRPNQLPIKELKMIPHYSANKINIILDDVDYIIVLRGFIGGVYSRQKSTNSRCKLWLYQIHLVMEGGSDVRTVFVKSCVYVEYGMNLSIFEEVTNKKVLYTKRINIAKKDPLSYNSLTPERQRVIKIIEEIWCLRTMFLLNNIIDLPLVTNTIKFTPNHIEILHLPTIDFKWIQLDTKTRTKIILDNQEYVIVLAHLYAHSSRNPCSCKLWLFHLYTMEADMICDFITTVIYVSEGYLGRKQYAEKLVTKRISESSVEANLDVELEEYFMENFVNMEEFDNLFNFL
jgi:hypothetical protein